MSPKKEKPPAPPAKKKANPMFGDRSQTAPKRKWKPTPAQLVNYRVDEMMDLLASTPNATRYKLHAIYCDKWKVNWQTVDRYYDRARKELLQRMDRKKPEFVANSVAFYESVISDRHADYKDRIRAQARLDELLGLKSPTRVELSGVGGTPLQLESKAEVHLDGLTVEELRAAIAFAEQKAPADNKGT